MRIALRHRRQGLQVIISAFDLVFCIHFVDRKYKSVETPNEERKAKGGGAETGGILEL